MKKAEVVIIGGGPHALSLAVRLSCNQPWDECAFDVNSNRRDFISTKKNDKCSSFDLNNLVVIDSYGQWLQEWKGNFETLEITHLRSSILVHTDAFDSMSLLEYVEKENETEHLPNVFDSLKTNVHKQTRKKKTQRMNNTCHAFNEAQRKFFTIPSSKLFLKHANWLIEKHALERVVTKGTVERLEYQKKQTEYPLKVFLSGGEIIQAKNVIYAGNKATDRIPKWANSLNKSNKLFHTSDIFRLKNLIEGERKNILIVGGGLSALHASIAASKHGHKVTVISKSPLKVRQFDIPPIWMSSLRNCEFSKFYSLSIEERYFLIKSTRGGGSVTPEIFSKFQKQVKNNQISFFEEAEISSLREEDELIQALITNKTTQETFSQLFDVVVLATGREFSLTNDSESLLHKFYNEYPIPTYEGFPILTSSLRWNAEIPFYVMGAYASLEIGPDALNLMGGRNAASRIIPDLIVPNETHEDHDCDEAHHSLTNIHVCNRFAALAPE